jgi:hypothetical protein
MTRRPPAWAAQRKDAGHDTMVYRSSGIDGKLAGRSVMADGAYRGNPEVVIPYRKSPDDSTLPQWQNDLDAVHAASAPGSSTPWPG